MLNTYTYWTIAVRNGNSHGTSFCRCTTSPHSSPESVPTHVTELRHQPLRVGPESPSTIGYQSINGGENGPYHLLGLPLCPASNVQQTQTLICNIICEKPLPGSFVCKAWDAIRHQLWKADQAFVYSRGLSTMKSSNGPTMPSYIKPLPESKIENDRSSEVAGNDLGSVSTSIIVFESVYMGSIVFDIPLLSVC